MTLPKNTNRLERFIHEHIHETERDLLCDFIATIIEKWEQFKDVELLQDLRCQPDEKYLEWCKQKYVIDKENLICHCENPDYIALGKVKIKRCLKCNGKISTIRSEG